MADIIFNIATGKFAGTVDDYSFSTYAWSGGRGGSKTIDAAHPVIVNNPLLTSMKLPQKHGPRNYAGPLPMGYYTLAVSNAKKNWIRLNPASNNVMYHRNGFAIHGRGPRGSDGCIVPRDFKVVEKLYQLTKSYQDKNKSITLEVKAVGDIDFFIKEIKLYKSIA